MEKDAAGYPSLPLHYGLMNPGISRTSPAAYPTSRAVLRGGGGGDVTSLPDPWVGNHPGLPGPRTLRGPSATTPTRSRPATTSPHWTGQCG